MSQCVFCYLPMHLSVSMLCNQCIDSGVKYCASKVCNKLFDSSKTLEESSMYCSIVCSRNENHQTHYFHFPYGC